VKTVKKAWTPFSVTLLFMDRFGQFLTYFVAVSCCYKERLGLRKCYYLTGTNSTPRLMMITNSNTWLK